MKKYLSLMIAPLIAVSSSQMALADNVADCELFLRQPVEIEGEATGAFLDTYAPAGDFITSVYDAEEGHVTEVEGEKIKAVFCTRHNVIPTLRDFPILATGFPFIVSTDFDAADSRILTIYFKDGEFHHVYNGPELSSLEQAQVNDAMEIFNLQPHDLDSKPKAANKPKKKDVEPEAESVEEPAE